MTTINVATSEYLEAEARKRNVSKTKLVQMLLDVIVKDKLVDATLDDAEEVARARCKGGSYTRQRSQTRTTLVQAIRSNIPGARPPVANAAGRPRKAGPMTRNEMNEMLASAVVNTGGHRISLEDRKAIVIEKITALGRVGWADLTPYPDEQQRWVKAIQELLAEGTIYRNEPEAGTRRVYFELRPQTSCPSDNAPRCDSETAPACPPSGESSDDSVAPSDAGQAAEGANALEIPSFLRRYA